MHKAILFYNEQEYEEFILYPKPSHTLHTSIWKIRKDYKLSHMPGIYQILQDQLVWKSAEKHFTVEAFKI